MMLLMIRTSTKQCNPWVCLCADHYIDEHMFPSSYAGSDYFCESGNLGEGVTRNPGAMEIILYVSDHSEMVKGVLVHRSPARFCKKLSQTTTDVQRLLFR